MLADLHSHTRFSDGTTTPETNAALASAAGLGGLAITDHDTLAHLPESQAACAAHRLAWIPGLELSAEEGAYSVHVLGLWIDPDNAALQAELDRLGNERDRRARAMVDNLVRAGIDVTFERVQEIAGDAPLGRPHMAQAIVEAGGADSVADAFDRWVSDDAPAYEPKRALAPEQAVRLIADAGGVAVLAHPGLAGRYAEVDEPLLDRLVKAGLAGVESDHPGHDAVTVAFWRSAARARGLAVTGGSDFHGERKTLRIGDASTPLRVVEALRGL